MQKISNFDDRDLAGPRAHPLIVHSHLRWDFVWQRPQQLLSRLARTAPVLFVEEPIHLDDISANDLELTRPYPNVTRAIPRLTSSLRGNYDESITAVRQLLLDGLAPGGRLGDDFANAVQWFYTPMPAPAMLGAFNESGVVYDCMDELSQFRNAPPDLVRRERLLIANADVVFTGGHRLYKAKSALHDNVHFFGCGVDVSHFGKARSESTEIPVDAAFDSPVAGYFGVIDERLDYDLIRTLAETYPECTVLMVGPTAKVNPDELPQAPNIHWLGQRSYEELPAYVKAFDVCLMPFALNEATEYINPTKTLEYMAAAKPIVSTAVPDVVRNFTPIVTVAADRDEFVSAAIDAAANPSEAMINKGVEMAQASSWENIVTQMQNIIADTVDKSAILDSISKKSTRRVSQEPETAKA